MSPLAALAVVLAASPCPGGVCPPGTSIPPQVVAASVRVQQGPASGSGTVVQVTADRLALVLTCRHVVAGGAQPVRVTFAAGETYEGVFLAADEHADLAAVAVALRREHAAAAAPLAATAARSGEVCWQVGYPGGRGPVVRQGPVRDTGLVSAAGVPVLGTGFPVQPGDSGSGLVRVADGALVGVVWGSSPEGAAATPLPAVERFLSRACPRWCPPRPPAVPRPADGELAALRGELAWLRTELEQLRQRPGPPGPRGERGPPGEPGPPGADAAVRQELADVRQQLQALHTKLNTLSGSIRVKVEPVPAR